MVEFEPAEQRDLPLLFALNKALIDEYEDLTAIDYDRVLLWMRQNLEVHLPDFHRILYEGEPAGFFCLSDSEVDSLFVLPQFRGKGIGTEVIRHCQSTSPSLLLYVFRRNTGAVNLYRRMGFQITKEVGKTRYIMEWKNQNL
jgi:ribosomal protein S18 acetylase RimI-like enzyme